MRALGNGHRSGNRSGFTLLEVVVALAVIALVVVSTLAAVTQQLNTAATAQHVMRAEPLAREKLGMLRLLPANQLQALPDSFAHGVFAPPNSDLSWQMYSSPVMGEYNLNDIGIEVQWADGSYVLHTRMYAATPGGTGAVQ